MKEKVLEYLQENGSITNYEANEEFGIVELKPIIEELIEDGNNIINRPVKKKVDGKRISYPKYYLIEEVKDEQD